MDTKNRFIITFKQYSYDFSIGLIADLRFLLMLRQGKGGRRSGGGGDPILTKNITM